MKYYEHNFYTPNTGTTCYEVETQAYNGDPANNDTRFWVGYYDGNNNLVYRSLDDDGGAGRYSKARIYLGISGQIKFYVSAFDKNFNSIKFETKIKRLNLGESACTTGQSLPWVKSKTFTTTFSDNTN
ncbi:MAG TPA: hypothetical protein VJ385_17695 [Fibrobacteria bacterium]|nr:hypothetical protein [Fibrobacteria bacterium]